MYQNIQKDCRDSLQVLLIKVFIEEKYSGWRQNIMFVNNVRHKYLCPFIQQKHKLRLSVIIQALFWSFKVLKLVQRVFFELMIHPMEKDIEDVNNQTNSMRWNVEEILLATLQK